MSNFSAVIFDVDGVLLDSLSSHLQICKEKNREYGLGLLIPNADDFRKMVRRGVKISPMNFFFQAVGFPKKYADLAFLQYKEFFMRDYAPKPFPQTDKMLSLLFSAGFKLGIVTSNVRANVDVALSSNMRFFDPECIFTMEDSVSSSKKDVLISMARKLDIDIIKIIYIGDQPSDWIAAQEACMKFLGVTYGWGISREDKEFPAVDTVMGIVDYLLDRKTV